ncbi:hypothetical protein ABT369_17785 [Dactylosporangium sp. NPDC000244]|uniref:hypothetical protein n=1 Tax=Dactylosporangium sp. NPDC000244 TaxID=3154365 RepID=UPI00331EE830
MLPWFALTREEYVAQQGEDALRRSELLTLDGWWIELGYLVMPVRDRHGASACRVLSDAHWELAADGTGSGWKGAGPATEEKRSSIGEGVLEGC